MKMMRSRSRAVFVSLALTLVACNGRTLGALGDEDESSTSGDTQTGDGDGDDPEQELSEEDLAEIAAVPGELEEIVARVLIYFAESDPHLCPHPEGSPGGGSAYWTPSLDLNCNLGPEGRCVPLAEGAGEPGTYEYLLWEDNSVWASLGWMRPEGVPHSFHYDLEIVNEGFGDGPCSFTAIASADFDNDLVFSRYAISGVLDGNDVEIQPIVIEDPFE